MKPYRLLLPLLLATWCLAAEGAIAYTPFALEIIQPHAGLDTRNRFYRAYPGLEYSVPVSAIGGVFPYRYALTAAPAGMTIDASTGVITWPSPAEGTVEVTVTVTDAAQAVQQVRWPITVTGEGWLFVDAAAPEGGTGTREAPFRTLLQVYGGSGREAKYADAHRNRFVYVKDGTYLLDGFIPNGADVQWTDRQPVVFLAYPGTRPKLDLTGRYLQAETALDNFYLDGFEVGPMTAKMGFRLLGGSSDVTFWRLRFSDLAASKGSDNQSCIMSANGGDGKRWAILDSSFTRVHHGYGIIGYAVEKLLVGRCSFTEMDDPTGTSSLPVGPKVDCQRWVVRENRFARNAVQNVWLYYVHHEKSPNPYGEMEVAYNLIEAGDGPDAFALTINQGASAVTLPSYIYRNTIVGRIQLFWYQPEFAPMHFRDNVLVGLLGKPDAKTVVTDDGIRINGPASAVEASGNVRFDAREGNLNPDGSLVKPVPGKGHVITAVKP
jgi:hypothetical protein